MIQGLFIDVTSEELKKMLLGRLEYHKNKLAVYQKQLGQLEEVEKTLQAEAEVISKTSHGSPKSSMEQAIKKHSDQIIYYEFMAAHVVPSETYRLGEQELTRLGVSSERYY